MAITFLSNNVEFKLVGCKKVKNWIKKTIEDKHKKTGEITYVFCNDEFILDKNLQYLNHNYFTDIITFDYSDEKTLNGDIFISIETVKSNSEKYKTEFRNELMRVIIHGVLHLVGFKDKTKKEKAEMRKAENEAIEIFNKI